MRSHIDRKLPPSQKGYYLTIHQQPVHLQCQTHISSAPIPETDNQEQPYIENFYCYTHNNELVKVTKIRIGEQLVTLVDRMSFNHQFPKEDIRKDSSGGSSQQEMYTQLQTSNKKVRLSVVARNVLRLLEDWVKQHEPDLLFILQKVKEVSRNEIQLKNNLSLDSGLREAFIRFNEHLSSLRAKRTLRRVVDNWGKIIIPVQDMYLRNQEFLNSILNVRQQEK